jgi:hypothetical protein
MSNFVLTNPSNHALLRMGDHELNELFTRSSPGELPVGRTDGLALLLPGTPVNVFLSPLIYRLPGAARISILTAGC